MEKGDKKGQMKLSFGMIFSIILIVVFIAFATYGITKFLNLQENIKTKQFYNNLQVDIDKNWKSSQSSDTYVYTLPKNIIEVCFRAEGYGDVVELRLELGIAASEEIKHSNIPIKFCVDVVDRKVEIKLEKKQGEALVIISE